MPSLSIVPKISLKEALENLLKNADGKPVKLAVVMQSLAGRGYPALLVLIGLPFCFPLQIPGFSTPFGLFLAFMGLRIAFGKQIHCPEFLNRDISYESLERIVNTALWGLKKTHKIVKERLSFLSTSPRLHQLHGVVIFFLGLTLALPLPIPFTNLLVAAPIVSLGLGLLEDDGVFVIIGYILSFIAVGFFGAILWYGFSFLGNS